jgi:hypothetical protein
LRFLKIFEGVWDLTEILYSVMSCPSLTIPPLVSYNLADSWPSSEWMHGSSSFSYLKLLMLRKDSLRSMESFLWVWDNIYLFEDTWLVREFQKISKIKSRLFTSSFIYEPNNKQGKGFYKSRLLFLIEKYSWCGKCVMENCPYKW